MGLTIKPVQLNKSKELKLQSVFNFLRAKRVFMSKPVRARRERQRAPPGADQFGREPKQPPAYNKAELFDYIFCFDYGE